MPMSCAAFNCTNRFLKGNGISFHRFPFSKPDLIEHWLVNIRRQGWKPSKYSHICSDHFDDDCYIGGPHRRRVLKADAVPTKFNFTIKDPRKLPLKSDNQEFPECLIQIKEEADNDDWPNPPAEYCASPVEGKKTILRDNHLEQLSNIDDSAKSSDSESFHEQEEESSSSEDHSEDDSVKPPDSGVFQIQYGELITSESYSEEQNSSSVDYTAKPLENGIFQVQKIELISSEDDQSQDSLSEEQEFSDIYYSALPSSAAEIQREPIVQDIYGQKWTMGTPKSIAVPETSMQIFIIQQQMLPHHSNLGHNKRFQTSDVALRASSNAAGNALGSMLPSTNGKFRNQSTPAHQDKNSNKAPNQPDSSARNIHFPSAHKRVHSSENEEHELRIKLLKSRIVQENEFHEMKLQQKKQQHELDLMMQMKLHKLLIKHQNELHQLNIERLKSSEKD